MSVSFSAVSPAVETLRSYFINKEEPSISSSQLTGCGGALVNLVVVTDLIIIITIFTTQQKTKGGSAKLSDSSQATQLSTDAART